MLSTPATSSQANKVSNEGNHAREETKRTLKANSTLDLYIKPLLPALVASRSLILWNPHLDIIWKIAYITKSGTVT